MPNDISNLDWAHDERRFLGLLPAEKPTPQAATILQNWQSAIKKP